MATALKLKGIDHLIRVVPDLAGAHDAMRRLGLNATAPGGAGDTGAANVTFAIGQSPERAMLVEYMGLPAGQPVSRRNAEIARLMEAGGGMYMIVFPVEDLAPARAAFDGLGGFGEAQVGSRGGRPSPVHILAPKEASAAGCRFLLMQYPPGTHAVDDPAAIAHDLPVRRVDHIAIIPPDLEAGTRYWTDVLGATWHAELTVQNVFVRQLLLGDIIVELLRPESDSPLGSAEVGLRPVLSCEVDDVRAAVDFVRARGFKATDPAPSGTGGLTTSLHPRETAGLRFSLVQRS